MAERPPDIGQQAGVEADRVPAEPEESAGLLYDAVTEHWPRMATGLVVALGLVELVLGGLTADSGLELLLVTWAGTTGGVWFLFEKAEASVSQETREEAAAWLMRSDLSDTLASFPEQFSGLFDSIFGDRHLSWKCFQRSSVASMVAVVVNAPLVFAIGQMGGPMFVGTPGFGWGLGLLAPALVAVAMLVNLIPDYVSLLETRWMMRFAARSGWILLALTLDFIATFAIGVVTWGFGAMLIYLGPGALVAAENNSPALGDLLALVIVLGLQSTFFTSVWLWLYGVSVPASRLLVRMNAGVGFLLRVTDVERQPFRSLGFVGVILMSLVFALLLPLVLV